MQNETRRGQEEAAWVLHQNQEELQSTCQGQEESVDGARKPAQSTCKGKKPAHTLQKEGQCYPVSIHRPSGGTSGMGETYREGRGDALTEEPGLEQGRSGRRYANPFPQAENDQVR